MPFARIRRFFFALPVILLLIIQAGCLFPGAIEDLNVKQFESALKKEKDLVIVDSRTEFEYLSGHIPGAVNIPQENLPVIATFLPPGKDTPIIFYCGGYS